MGSVSNAGQLSAMKGAEKKLKRGDTDYSRDELIVIMAAAGGITRMIKDGNPTRTQLEKADYLEELSNREDIDAALR